MRAVKAKRLRRQAREETKGQPVRGYFLYKNREARNHPGTTRGRYLALKKIG